MHLFRPRLFMFTLEVGLGMTTVRAAAYQSTVTVISHTITRQVLRICMNRRHSILHNNRKYTNSILFVYLSQKRCRDPVCLK